MIIKFMLIFNALLAILFSVFALFEGNTFLIIIFGFFTIAFMFLAIVIGADDNNDGYSLTTHRNISLGVKGKLR